MTECVIRWAEPSDARAVAALYAVSVVDSAVSFEAVAPSADEMRSRIAKVQACAPFLVCEYGGKVIGYTYATRHRERAAYQWSLDSSIFVDRSRHRMGVGRQLYSALFELLRLQGYHALHAGIALPNPASIGLHEALGFRRVAVYPKVGWKMGAWHDVGWWQLELMPRTAEPAVPLTPLQAQQTYPAQWAAVLAGPQGREVRS